MTGAPLQPTGNDPKGTVTESKQAIEANLTSLELVEIGQEKAAFSQQELEGKRITVAPTCEQLGMYLVQIAGVWAKNIDHVVENDLNPRNKAPSDHIFDIASITKVAGWLLDNRLKIGNVSSGPWVKATYQDGDLTDVSMDWKTLGETLMQLGKEWREDYRQKPSYHASNFSGNPVELEVFGEYMVNREARCQENIEKYGGPCRLIPDEVALAIPPI